MNCICITDPVEVFQLLERYGKENFNPRKNHFAFFSCDHEFAALVFVHDGRNKGPHLYLFRKPVTMQEMETALVERRTAMSDDTAQSAFDAAIHELRSMLETREAACYFFDAH